MYVKNFEGLSRFPNCNNYVRMTLLATKAAIGESIDDVSFAWLYQLMVG